MSLNIITRFFSTDAVSLLWGTHSTFKILKTVYKKFVPLVEAGSNTSTVALRVVRWRQGNPVPENITGPPCSWGIKIRGRGPPGWGSLESERVKYVHESRGTRTWDWLRWRGPAAIINDREVVL
jgi:hypothetical protein